MESIRIGDGTCLLNRRGLRQAVASSTLALSAQNAGVMITVACRSCKANDAVRFRAPAPMEKEDGNEVLPQVWPTSA